MIGGIHKYILTPVEFIAALIALIILWPLEYWKFHIVLAASIFAAWVMG